MIDLIKNITIVSGALTAFIVAFFAIRKFYRSFFPLKIASSMEFNLIEENKDSFATWLTNRSTETIFITDCYVKEAKSLKRALYTHFRRPFIKPSLYHNVWWGSLKLGLMNSSQVKLEAGESIELKYNLNFTHPINSFLDHRLRVVVKLSSGKTIKSKRLQTPKRWHISSHLSRA